MNKKIFCDVDGVLLPLLSIDGFEKLDSGYVAEYAAGVLAGNGKKFLQDAEMLYSIGSKAKKAREDGPKLELSESEMNVFNEYREFLPAVDEMIPGIDYHAIFAMLRKKTKPADVKLLRTIGSRYPVMKGAADFLREFRESSVIVSMTPEPLIRSFAGTFGISNLNVFATRFEIEAGEIKGVLGGIKGVMKGHGKRQVLLESISRNKLPIAIGDSTGDWEMLEAASKREGLAIAFLPNESLLKKVCNLKNALVFVKADFKALSRVVKNFDGRIESVEMPGDVFIARDCASQIPEIMKKIEAERLKQDETYRGQTEELLKRLAGVEK